MVTVILQHANLEIFKNNRGKVLLSSELPEARKTKEAHLYRPDILHQCLLMLLDSPLNKSKQLEILIFTTNAKIIKVYPHTRIPRVYSRFTGLMIQLLERQRIYSSPDREILLEVVKGPLSSHVPHDAPVFGLSQEGVHFRSYFKEAKLSPAELKRAVFYINAIASGSDDFEGVVSLSLSEYALSAASCCSKICSALEEMLGVF
ncbi:rRNA small subunit pseudouridine methyltransferase Nep1 [Nematocida homosporus]|uniref:rRNA small subunit pseudouridine methyltransferase Nep1 n=1 Tax=Nematocida homosporus TaxID=1912981 RepID=UPI0022210C12|nr:rRNA small subunit pseudouridine methyltransferase Nep1 [Nematocida homosporus]KAI5186418.1 rRNA small subunit pseudouridine methyltransferase Nep1 [Nematocida homosporus]